MTCDLCSRPFKDGDEVVVEMNGQIVNGEVMQTEAQTVLHEECPE